MIYVLRYLKMNAKASKMQGFSLIEVMFACVVLVVGILATIDLMGISIGHSMGARDHIITSELAQEGIELVRNVRDNNFAAGKKAFEKNFPNDNSNDNCEIDKDISANDRIKCDSGANSKKLYLDRDGFYVHSSKTGSLDNTEVKFQRKIGIAYNANQAADATSAEITSMVIWGSDFPADCGSCNVSSKCVCVEDVLTDWK